MRCYCCGKPLTDYEMSLKGKISGQYLEMSLSCIRAANIAYIGNNALKKQKVEEEPSYEPINLAKPKWEQREDEDF